MVRVFIGIGFYGRIAFCFFFFLMFVKIHKVITLLVIGHGVFLVFVYDTRHYKTQYIDTERLNYVFILWKIDTPLERAIITRIFVFLINFYLILFPLTNENVITMRCIYTFNCSYIIHQFIFFLKQTKTLTIIMFFNILN